MHNDIERVLFSEERIREGIARVAKEITASLGNEELTVVSVLKGACIFSSDLIRQLPIPLQLSFLGASSYGDETDSGDVKLTYFPREEIENRRVLVVDDILDTGNTMSSIMAEMRSRGALDVKSCVFLDKPARRELSIEADFRVFEVENVFVVGYGLDYAGKYRNLPFVGALKEHIFSTPAETGA